MAPDAAPYVEVLVGRVGRAHGVRGDVTIDVRTDEPDRRFAVGTDFRTPAGTLTLESARWHGRRFLVRFAGVVDRTQAEALRGVELTAEVPARGRPADPAEYYDRQLVGLRVETVDGAVVGMVAEVLHAPHQELLVVRNGTDETLLPFVEALVPVVDLTAGRLLVADRPGLLAADTPADPPAAEPADPSADGG